MVNSFRCFSNIRNDNNYLVRLGSLFYEQVGLQFFNFGFIFLIFEIIVLIDFVKFMFIVSINSILIMMMMVQMNENVSIVDRMVGEMICLFICIGSMVFGCMMCLNLFCDILVRIIIWMYFIFFVVFLVQVFISMMIVRVF